MADTEEIERQRQDAMQMLESNSHQFSPSINYNEIPLRYKQRPVQDVYNDFLLSKKRANKDQNSDNDEANVNDEKKEQCSHNNITPTKDDSDNDDGNETQKKQQQKDEELVLLSEFEKTFFPCWSSRGHADLSELQALLQEGYNYSYAIPKSSNVTAAASADARKTTTTTTTSSTLKNRGDVNNVINIKSDKSNKNHNINTISKTTMNDGSKTTTTKTTTAPPSAASIPGMNRPKYTVDDIQSITNLWCPANASIHNVHICRPAHDAWGIGKIILLFCDDFLQDVYELPFWYSHPQKIKNAVQPILDRLQISSDRIVRLLFASLPPGGTIPVHYDTGEWVKYTHRIHCPILVSDPDKIVFQCGINEHCMSNIHCTPGHVFEINNQANHFVCNGSSDHRVHLILDYVDEDYYVSCNNNSTNDNCNTAKQRVQLEPGETVVQTRRSIDRLINYGQRPTPSFFILGAQKAGTTTLYETMIQHPLIIPARGRETHCFDWRWNPKLTTIERQREWVHKFYYTDELRYHPSCCTGDSTPSYLIDSRRVIPRLRSICTWPVLFLVMVREPIARAQSHYAMVTSLDGTPEQMKARGSEWRTKTFYNVMMDDLKHMNECGLIPYWNMNATMDGQEFDSTIFEQFSGSKEEDIAWDLYLSKYVPLNTGSYGLISRGLYELNLRPWLRAYANNNYDDNDLNKQFYIIKLEDMKNNNIQDIVQNVWKLLNLPNSMLLNDTQPKNTRVYNKTSMIDGKTMQYLQRFYRPHNERLQARIKTTAHVHCYNGNSSTNGSTSGSENGQQHWTSWHY